MAELSVEPARPIGRSIMAVSAARDGRAARFVLTLTAAVTLEDVATVLPFLIDGEARGYTILLDMRAAREGLYVGDLRRMPSLLVALDAGTPKSCRVALVTEHDPPLQAFEKALVVMIGEAGFPIRVFTRRSDAETWLAGEADGAGLASSAEAAP